MTLASDPVHVVTGAHVHVDPSFAISGLIPLVVGSVYSSDHRETGPFGRGRLSSLDPILTVTDDRKVRLRDDGDCPAEFALPAVAGEDWIPCNTARRLQLLRDHDGAFVIKDGKLLKRFQSYPGRVWHLVAIEDPNHNRVILERGASGALASLATPEGLRVSFTHDASNLRLTARLHGVDGSEREIMRWSYDDQGRLREVDATFGPSARYGYDARHRQVSTRSSDGFSSEHVYDALDRVVAVHTNGSYDGDRFEYDEERRETRYIPGGQASEAITYRYNENGLVVAEVDALGAVKRKEFNGRGDVVAEIDGEGRRTAFTYDHDGNLASRVDAEARRMVFRWGPLATLEAVTDGAGNTWTYSYDARGNLVAAQDPLGFRTDFAHDNAGLLTGIMRHNGLIERRTYDAHKRLVGLVDLRGARTTFAHDGFGRVIAITDATGNTTRFEYRDQLEYDFWTPSRTMRPDGVATSVEFNWITRERTETDGEARRFVNRYGKRGLLEEVRDPFGHTTRFVYDGRERILRVENQQGHAWTFERDSCGRVVRDRNLDGVDVTYAYDRAGQVVSIVYVDGTRIGLGYDGSGLLVSEKLHEPGSAVPRLTRFAYDRRGLLIEAENDAAVVHFERDGKGQVTVESADGRRIENVFDCCGNRVERRIDDRLLRLAYDPVGAVRTVTIEDHEPLVFHRDALGRETRRGSRRGFALDQAYDPVGRLVGQVAGNVLAWGDGADAALIDPTVRRAFTWSRAFEPTTIHDDRWGPSTYTFDGRGQTIAADFADGTAERFGYDAAMNVARSTVPGEAPTQWLRSVGGRVKVARGPRGERIVLTHDPRGRVVERVVERDGFRRKAWRYAWDGQDRLIQCWAPDGTTWRYAYDPFGRRVLKTTPVADQRRAVANGTPVIQSVCGSRYLWDGELMVEEAPITQDGTDPERAIYWYYEPGSFRPLASLQPGAGLLFVVTDHLGTPRDMLDEGGATRWAASFSVWGEIRKSYTLEGSTGVGCPIRFQGQWADDETGLFYNRFRYFDPLVANYTGPDPIGILGGLRSHGYVTTTGNKVDPLGLAVYYGPLDSLGRPTGASADLSIGDLRPTGTSPPTFDPPGWQGGGDPFFQQRGHLIADSFGGSGSDARNLVTVTDGTNNPGMKNIEDKVRRYIRSHPNCQVHYVVRPNYDGKNPTPTSITMYAVSSDGTEVASGVVPNGMYQNRK